MLGHRSDGVSMDGVGVDLEVDLSANSRFPRLWVCAFIFGMD